MMVWSLVLRVPYHVKHAQQAVKLNARLVSQLGLYFTWVVLHVLVSAQMALMQTPIKCVKLVHQHVKPAQMVLHAQVAPHLEHIQTYTMVTVLQLVQSGFTTHHISVMLVIQQPVKHVKQVQIIVLLATLLRHSWILTINVKLSAM